MTLSWIIDVPILNLVLSTAEQSLTASICQLGLLKNNALINAVTCKKGLVYRPRWSPTQNLSENCVSNINAKASKQQNLRIWTLEKAVLMFICIRKACTVGPAGTSQPLINVSKFCWKTLRRGQSSAASRFSGVTLRFERGKAILWASF